MNRREMLKVGGVALVGSFADGAVEAVSADPVSSRTAERWEVFEARFAGQQCCGIEGEARIVPVHAGQGRKSWAGEGAEYTSFCL